MANEPFEIESDSAHVRNPGDWNADEAFQSLVNTTVEAHGGDHIKHAAMIIHDAAPIAAHAIVHAARFSPVEKTRLDAAKYILERALGKASDVSEINPLESLLAEAVAASRVPN